MVLLNSIAIEPALINSSCAWASDYDQLKELYVCPHTGAVTTRTATLTGYQEDSKCGVAFAKTSTTTINSYGYSPHPLASYLGWVKDILARTQSKKPFIISITASKPEDLRLMVEQIQELRAGGHESLIGIELNTSCPNVPNSPPSGYTPKSLVPLLEILSEAYNGDQTLTTGLKLPPYTYQGQFDGLIEVLKEFSYETGEEKKNAFSFLTCTNTLGNSILFEDEVDKIVEKGEFAVPTVLGGIGGEAMHALALGNVYTFSRLLSSTDGLERIKIVGVGGVTSAAGMDRMRKAGAAVVGCATLLGKEGVSAFANLIR